MILAKATVVSGSTHAKYATGTSLPALLFVNTQADDDFEVVASRELAVLGWASVTIERYKDVEDYEQFQDKQTPEAEAFRDAIQTGFGVVVYP